MVQELIGYIKGEQGPVGPQGPQGEKGESGASDWSDITNKPETFPPETHTHTKNQITDFPSTVVMEVTFTDQTTKTYNIYGSEINA